MKISDCQCNNNCDCNADYYALCEKLEVIDPSAPNPSNLDVRFLFKCNFTDSYDIVKISAIQTVCFFVEVEDNSYIATPVNSMENE